MSCINVKEVMNNDGLQLTRLSDGIYSAYLSPLWDVWGPNGGYLCALLLRAVGLHTTRALPVSFSGQYLRSPSYDEVKVHVELIKQGRDVSAYRVHMEQGDRIMLNATVWAADPKDGMDYQNQRLPCHHIPLAQAGDRPPVGSMPMWDNLEIKQVKNDEGYYSHWYRFITEMNIDDPFIDAGRSLILIDTMQWPARYFMEKKPPAFVAPSLDLYVQFHRFNKESEWLFSDATSDLANQGLVAGHASVWDEKGQLLASGGSQSLLMAI